MKKFFIFKKKDTDFTSKSKMVQSDCSPVAVNAQSASSQNAVDAQSVRCVREAVAEPNTDLRPTIVGSDY